MIRCKHASQPKDQKGEAIYRKALSTPGFFPIYYSLNDKKLVFVTNSSEDKSKGSSLYLVTSHGTIRCKTDHSQTESCPMIILNPFMVGYQKTLGHTGKVTTLNVAVGLYPFESEATSLEELQLQKIKTHGYSRHHGHKITEIITLKQLNNSQFMPKTWVNCAEVGMLWPEVVHHLKKAEAEAKLDHYGHYVHEKIVLSKGRNKGCIIS